MSEKFPLALKEGSVLAGQYIIEEVLGQGGFGITYKAKDHKSGSLVAIKEFFPDTMATREGTTVISFTGERAESYEYGKNCFLQEAKTLAQFIDTDSIVKIHTYFEENSTAYFVMDYVEGESLEEYIKKNGNKISYEDAERLLLPVMEALSAVHEKGIVHRDVTPDNIFICNDGKVKLLDFGAARYSIGDKSKSLDVVLKHGFAPKEQYTRRGKQGAFTDVYSLGATFYYAITGKKLPDSIDRLEEDDMIPPSTLGVNISEEKEEVLFKAISVQPQDRYQTMREFINALKGETAANVGKTVAVPQADNAVGKTVPLNVSPANVPPQDTGTAVNSDNSEFGTSDNSNPKTDKKNFILPAIIIGGSLIVAAIVLGIIFTSGKAKTNADLDDPDEIEIAKDDDEDDSKKSNGGSGSSGKNNATPEPTEPPAPQYLEAIENPGYFDAQVISNLNNCGIVADSDIGTFVYVPGTGLCLYTRDNLGNENYALYIDSPDDITYNVNVVGDKVLYTINCVPYLMNIDGSDNGRCTNFGEDVYVRRVYANENGAFIEEVGDPTGNDASAPDYLYYQDWNTGMITPPISIRSDSDIAILEDEIFYISDTGELYKMRYSDLLITKVFDENARPIKHIFDIAQSEIGQNEMIFFSSVSEGDDQYDYFFTNQYVRADDYYDTYARNGYIYLEKLGVNKSTSYNINNFYSAASAYFNGQFYFEIENNESGVDYHNNNLIEIFEVESPNMSDGTRKYPTEFLSMVDPPIEGCGLCFSPKYRKYYYLYYRDSAFVLFEDNLDNKTKNAKWHTNRDTQEN